MSELLKTIKEDQVQARKDGHKVPTKLLTTLLGEASPSGKETTTDAEVIKTIRKFVKNIIETNTIAGSSPIRVREIAILSKYLPQVFSKVDIHNLLSGVEIGNVGMVMGMCKAAAAKEDKMFDGALVKEVINELT